MFAIIQSGSKQFRVTPGGFATLDGTAGEPGAELTLGQVLLVEKDDGGLVAGAPFVADARVIAVVDGETRGPKIRVFKKKRRKGMRRTNGHRSTYTRVRIKEILL
jgi:large subunit ribosomal protein L21